MSPSRYAPGLERQHFVPTLPIPSYFITTTIPDNVLLYSTDVHAEVSEDRRRMTAERMTNERIGEARQHARIEDTETSLLLPRYLCVWSQQVLHS